VRESERGIYTTCGTKKDFIHVLDPCHHSQIADDFTPHSVIEAFSWLRPSPCPFPFPNERLEHLGLSKRSVVIAYSQAPGTKQAGMQPKSQPRQCILDRKSKKGGSFAAHH
jgi:hypothetical protein